MAPASGAALPQSEPVRPGAELFTTSAVCRMRIEIRTSDLAGLRQHPRTWVRALVRDQTIRCQDVALHLKGSTGSFRSIDEKPGLTLEFGRFRTDQRFHGLQRIHLNNCLEDPGYVNQALGSELFQAAGVPAPRVTYAWVELNDRRLGLYVLQEGFTDDLLAGHFRRTDGHFFETDGEPRSDQSTPSGSTRRRRTDESELDPLVAAALEPEPGRRWQRLQTVLDVDRFVSFMAMEVMLGHRDGYCLARNNYRVYHDLDSGKMVFLPQGMDQLFGNPDLPLKPRMAGLVARALLDIPEGRKRYKERFASLFTSLFRVEALTTRVDQLVARLRPVLARGDFRQVEIEAGLVKDRIVGRQASFERQLAQPDLARLQFDGGQAYPAGWVEVDPSPGGKLDKQNSPDGLSALHLTAGALTSASWRTTVLLGRGLYSLEGKARVADVRPLPSGKNQGAGLRVAGKPRRSEGLLGNSRWRQLRVEFQIDDATEEVELVCELRASAGEAWFELGSLKVTQIEPTHAPP